MLSVKFKVSCLFSSLIFTLLYFKAVFTSNLSFVNIKYFQPFVHHILKFKEIIEVLEMFIFNLKQLLNC